MDFHTGKRSLDPLIEAAESTPVLGEMFARVLGSIEIQSEHARALREEEAESRRYTSAPPREGPPLAERMAGLLARCEDGENRCLLRPVPGQNPIGVSALADGGRVGRARWHLSR